MDLKTFAVYKKLTANSTLLDYVVNNESIPIDVVEENLDELIASLHHDESEALVSDYMGHLKDTVKTNFSKKEDNMFDVSGQIDDPVIESIELLHGVEREDVVKGVVTNVMRDLNGDRKIEVDHVSLSDEADEFVRMAREPLFFEQGSSAVSESDIEDDVDDLIHDVLNNETIDTSDEDVLEELSAEEEVDLQDAAPDLEDVDIPDEDLIADLDEEDAHDQDIDPSDLEDLESLEEPMRDLHVGANEADEEDTYSEEVFDDASDFADEPDVEEEPEVSTAEAFKIAYDSLVQQLQEKGLDKKLPGLHLPHA